MTNARIHMLWQRRAACLVVAAVLLAGPAQAQLSLRRQKNDSIAARYKNEHAVYLEESRSIVIKEEGGRLAVSSTVVAEKLFISEKSLNMYNEDPVWAGTYVDLVSTGATALIPEGNDYRRVSSKDQLGHVNPAYSGLRKGAVTRTAFVQEYLEPRLLQGFYFGSGIPALHSYLEVTAPAWVKMGFTVKGADTSMIKRTVKKDGGNIIYRFTAVNLPALKEYDNVPSGTYYIAHVLPYIVSYKITGARKDSVLDGSIDAHARRQADYVHGINFKTDSFITRKTKELTRNAYSDREKVARIFEWVQNSFHYESLYTSDLEGFVPNPADTVCKRMYGDCKDMTSIISAMCEKAGIPAYCAVIGTNDKPYTHDEILSEQLYNHMICAVKLDGEWVFPDGTTHVQPLGTDRWDIQGKEALILLDGGKHKIVKIPEAPSSKNVTINNTVMNMGYDDITGTTYQHYSGYSAWRLGEDLKHLHRKEERDDYIRSLTMRGNNKFILTNYDVDASKTGNKDVTITTSYQLGGHVQRVKKECFVNMNLTNTFANLRMNETDRNFPMYLPFKRVVKETVTLNIPKGYRVTYVPKGAKGGVDGLWSYNITYKVNNAARTVTLTREYELKTMKIMPSQFEANNRLVDQLKKQYKETVVLTGK